MLFLYIFLFSTAVLGELLFIKKKVEWNSFLYWIIGVVLVGFSTFRIGDAFPDYTNYVEYYYSVIRGESVFVEYSFYIITYIATFLFHSPLGVFFIYGLSGVFLKLCAIKQMSQLCFLSIVIYIANTFLVQELIQIRAGIAAGILLFCIKPILERRWKKFILLVITAFFFHSSALAVLPLWFLKPNRLNVYFWGLLIPIGYVFAFLHINIFFFSVPLVQDKIDIYLSLQDTEDINLFNVLFIIKCFIGYLFLYYSSLLYFYNKYIFLLLKIYMLSLFSFLLFSSTPTIAFRLQGLYEVVDIVLFPYMIYIFKPWSLGKLIPISVASMYIYLLAYHSKLIFY